MPVPKELNKFDSLVSIIAQLRAPGGCPWDRRQTHASLRENLLQECYEVLEALDKGDAPKLCEELGDLLMQVVLHAQIAAEGGEFKLEDVVNGISQKLVHRHPHVFGGVEVSGADEVLHNWEALKREERDEGASMLESVPKELPSLSYSQEIQRRVARVGFDWEDSEGVIEKLVEEAKELEDAEDQKQKASEFGDLLFTLANLATHWGIELESALRETNQRFSRRFAYMEEVAHSRGTNVGELSFEEQNALWEEAKRNGV